MGKPTPDLKKSNLVAGERGGTPPPMMKLVLMTTKVKVMGNVIHIIPKKVRVTHHQKMM